MADNPNSPDLLFDSQPESSGFSNDDFEKLDAPGGGFGHDDVTTASGAYDHDVNQDAEISTTTDTDVAGEEEAEADRFAMGSHEELGHPSDPLISWGDEEEEDKVTSQVQPSAPVPDNIEPLVNFDDSPSDIPSGDDYLQSFIPSVPPTSTTPEPILSSSSPPPTQPDAFIEPKGEESEMFLVEESEPVVVEEESEPVVVEESEPVSEQTTVEAAEGSWLKGVDPRDHTEADDASDNNVTSDNASDSVNDVTTSDTASDGVSQCMIDLIYWREVKTTGLVFGGMLVVLLSLAIFSLMSVLAYLSLALLTVTFSFTVYKKIMGAVQKSSDGHPFKQLISMDITLSEDKLKSVIQSVLKNANCTASELRRLFLIEDMVDSIKFGLLLWVLTYVGAWFNGMTLVILAVISLFTLPKVYETYKVQIDNYIGLAKAQVDNVMNIVQTKLPFLKSKEKAQ